MFYMFPRVSGVSDVECSSSFPFFVLTVLVPDPFGPPDVALGWTRGYLNKKTKKKKSTT